MMRTDLLRSMANADGPVIIDTFYAELFNEPARFKPHSIYSVKQLQDRGQLGLLLAS